MTPPSSHQLLPSWLTHDASAHGDRAVTAASAVPFTFARPTWARGAVTERDAKFLHDLVVETRPRVAIEVGVASGCSSLVILKALAQVHGSDDHGWRLHAYDVTDRCYFDAHYPTGAAVGEFAPHLLRHYALTQGDARAARQHVIAGSVRLAFVDANHFHPWPVLDLMALVPSLAPGAWVALHDVRLPRLHLRTLRGHGPAHLFDAWPFEKRSGGDHDNVGAIRMPGRHVNLDDVWTRVLDQPWECQPPGDVLDALRVAPRPLAVKEMRGLRAIERAVRESRPLCVWGTGQAARTLVASLTARGVTPHALLERDEARRGTPVDGLRVLAPDDVRAMETGPALVLVSGVYRARIARALTAEGWQRDVDFVVL